MQSRLFPSQTTTPVQKKDMAQTLVTFARGALTDPDEAQALLQRHILPPSLRWSFCRNGKTGTTTVLAWLFQVEFGTPLTAPLARDATLNENSVAHYAVQADIFRPALAIPGGFGRLQQACRIATVRHPAGRAVSAFRYLCKSGALGAHQFLSERLRINAETGFDWDQDPGTPRGFAKFLDYVEILHETADLSQPATHWRSQCRNLRPDILPPTVLGRLESLDRLAQDLARELGLHQPPPMGHHNTQGAPSSDLLADPDLLRKIAEVYRDDYQTFGYDPEKPTAEVP
jgi:hypothetical protein